MAKKTRYRHIHFVQTVMNNVWNCINKRTKHILGTIYYYKPWNQFVYEPHESCVFSIDCLEDIIDFMKQLDGN